MLLLSKVLAVDLLVKGLLGEFLLSGSLEVSLLVLLVSLHSEGILVGGGHADEVGVGGHDDDAPGEFSEDVVLLLVLDVALLGGAPAVEDMVSLVDPDEVDGGPGSHEGSRDDHEDGSAWESASGGDGVLAEPDDEEGSGNVSRDEQSKVNDWVPPGDLVVEHQEELVGDGHGGEHDSEDTDHSETSLDGNDTAAGQAISLLSATVADAAAALLKDWLVLLGGPRSVVVALLSG